MSEYTIAAESAASAQLQAGDKIGIQEASSGRYKYVTGAQIKAVGAYVTLTSSATTLSAAIPSAT